MIRALLALALLAQGVEAKAAPQLVADVGSDTTFEDIADKINIGVPSARALVRAGQARLRERFRPAIPALFG